MIYILQCKIAKKKGGKILNPQTKLLDVFFFKSKEGFPTQHNKKCYGSGCESELSIFFTSMLIVPYLSFVDWYVLYIVHFDFSLYKVSIKFLPDICFVIMPACGHSSSSRLVRNGSIRTQDGVSFRDIMYRSLGS